MYKKAVSAMEGNADLLRGMRDVRVKGRFEQTLKEVMELTR